MVERGKVLADDSIERLRRELDEAYAIVRAIRAGAMSPLVVDRASGPDRVALRWAERRLEDARRDLEEARDTLQAIWAVGSDAMVIDADGAADREVSGGGERAQRLLVDGKPAGHRGSAYLRAVAVDYDGTLAEGAVAPDTGVTKGTGLLAALGEFGLSPPNALAVGDAENDHTLLDACEIGVAVSNAVEAIQERADLTLALADGQGVADLLRGPLLAGRVHLHLRRWEITLGTDASGERVGLPASQLDVAVWGGTGEGKSYLAGLICEQLVGLGYSLVVFDPEGDHVGLGELPGVIDPATKGYLLVTWRPEDLSGDALAGIDAVIALGSEYPEDPLVELTAAVAGMPRATIARMLEGPLGHAVLGWRAHPRQAVAFTVASRRTPHLRHEHKYDRAGADRGRRFYFRALSNIPTGVVAANMLELEDELVRCERDVLRHHCPGHDFSRWVSGVFHDDSLARVLSAAEAGVQESSPAAVVEQARLALIAALQARHSR
jgi:haloacid dehalogenase-like hydrolase/Helicase HerA, central domain